MTCQCVYIFFLNYGNFNVAGYLAPKLQLVLKETDRYIYEVFYGHLLRAEPSAWHVTQATSAKFGLQLGNVSFITHNEEWINTHVIICIILFCICLCIMRNKNVLITIGKKYITTHYLGILNSFQWVVNVKKGWCRPGQTLWDPGG